MALRHNANKCIDPCQNVNTNNFRQHHCTVRVSVMIAAKLVATQ